MRDDEQKVVSNCILGFTWTYSLRVRSRRAARGARQLSHRFGFGRPHNEGSLFSFFSLCLPPFSLMLSSLILPPLLVSPSISLFSLSL